MDPVLHQSATELAAKIRTGHTTSRAIVDAHIARIEAVNPRLRAMVADRFEAARAEADAADEAVARGDTLGPLHGVPCTIKESFAVSGMPWTAGLRARRGTTGEADAPAVARLRAAGAIVLGVTNTSELCMWMESSNSVYGRTGNPYDAGRIAGGSSGGEGSIVGAGGSPFGLGADVGGSIRLPAFFNGVFGHKPSPGLVPNAGQFPITHREVIPTLATGPLARRAVDLPMLLRVLADDPGRVGDPYAVDLAGLRVLDVPENLIVRPTRAMRDAQQAAAASLADAGAVVTTRHLPGLRRSFDLWAAAMGENEGKAAFRTLLGKRRRDLLRSLLRPAELGGEHTIPAILLGLFEDITEILPGGTRVALAELAALRAQMLDAIGDGVMLFPPYPETAPRHGAPMLKPLHWTYTAVLNALGLPVTQVPLGLDARGLPLGVQVVTAPGNDHIALAVALHLEASLGGWIAPPA